MLELKNPIPDIAGRVCTALLAQEYWHQGERVTNANVLFLRLEDGVWHRFFLDAGALFWRTVDAPTFPPASTDNEEHRYPVVDLAALHGFAGKKVVDVQAVDVAGGAELRLAFRNAPLLVLRDVEDQTELRVVPDHDRAS
jgi:hypothetical protein